MLKCYYLDLFAGIGGFSLGAYYAGMYFDEHYFSEIDDYAISIYQKRFPDAIPLGDIKNIKGERLPKGEWIITGGAPVKIFQWLARALGWKGADRDYGLSTRESLANYDRNSRSWKMSEPSLFEDSTEFSDRLPKSGIMRNGLISGPVIWERPTKGNGYGLWPTPDVRGFTNQGSLEMLTRATENWEEFMGMAYRVGMKKKEKIWPTPTARDWKDSGGQEQVNRHSPTLGVVIHWPTPRAAGLSS